MKRTVLSLLGVCLSLGVCAPGCAGAGFGQDPTPQRFRVVLADDTDRGSREAPKPIAVEPPDEYTFTVEALGLDGKRDTSFDGWVRLATKPGFINGVSGEEVQGRNIRLRRGVAENITATLARAYGPTRILVDDLGYIPADPLRDPPPSCSDGKDNDGDGLIDYPADPECAFANDDSEEGGSYAAGESETIFYRLPRAADVRGYQNGGTRTPFKSQTVQVDTGYREDTRDYEFSMVVTRLSSNGFYVTDLEDDRAPEERIGFNNLFAFNFNTPGNLGYCDRVRRLSGTATEFFGSIQLGYPTWAARRWNPKEEECLIPEPFWFKAADINNDRTKIRNVHGLVRVQTQDYDDNGTLRRTIATISSKLAPGFPRDDDGDDKVFTPPFTFLRFDDSENPDGKYGTNCDFNGDQTIDFLNDPEKSCAQACNDDPECTEWSNFASRSNFQITVQDGTVNQGTFTPTLSKKIQANGSTSPSFNAFNERGKVIRAFSGTLGYFSGGDQFTIEARCTDDIILDLEQSPKPSSEACVVRNVIDNDEEQ